MFASGQGGLTVIVLLSSPKEKNGNKIEPLLSDTGHQTAQN